MSAATLFLCGDVMTGRGIDQVLPHPVDPRLFESWVRDARDYVQLAERANGPIPAPVDDRYVWGDALDELAGAQPDLRIINLETAVTRCDEPWPGKGVHYRMSPRHVGCLTAAAIDCCVLANNHVLDWSRDGLHETVQVLHTAGLKTAGAGANLQLAQAPAILPLPSGARVLVYACGMPTSGVPADWAATPERSGIDYWPDLSEARIDDLAERVRRERRAGDLVVLSIHWGPNWGYDVNDAARAFAHALVDRAQVDVVHGHSSHHAKALEIYRDHLILYGCGDLLNDYEGIGGHEAFFRPDLSLMYFAHFKEGRLNSLRAVPTTVRRFRIERASAQGARELHAILQRECQRVGTLADMQPNGTLIFRAAP